MAQRLSLSPGELAEMRREYEETTIPVVDLALRHGVSRRSFYELVRKHAFGPRRYLAERRAGKAQAAPPQPDVPAPSPTSLPGPPQPDMPEPSPSDLPHTIAEQLQRTVQRELAAIEKILARLPGGNARSAQAERAARTLASLTRTLNEVHRLRREQSAPVTADDDDDMPRDIDEFRRELARRIDAFIASRADAAIPGDAD